jgi:hypothetical protein
MLKRLLKQPFVMLVRMVMTRPALKLWVRYMLVNWPVFGMLARRLTRQSSFQLPKRRIGVNHPNGRHTARSARIFLQMEKARTHRKHP